MHPEGVQKRADLRGLCEVVRTSRCLRTRWSTLVHRARNARKYAIYALAALHFLLARRSCATHTPDWEKGGVRMARVPITVYLQPDQLAGIERRAGQVGKTRSAWVADTLVRSLEDELLPLDEILLDQLTKVRAGLEVVAEAQVGRGPDSKKGLAELRQRRTDLATRMLAEARARLRR